MYPFRQVEGYGPRRNSFAPGRFAAKHLSGMNGLSAIVAKCFAPARPERRRSRARYLQRDNAADVVLRRDARACAAQCPLRRAMQTWSPSRRILPVAYCHAEDRVSFPLVGRPRMLYKMRELRISVAEARKNLANILADVASKKRRVKVTRYRTSLAGIVSREDLALLDECEKALFKSPRRPKKVSRGKNPRARRR